jgi:hypothetical protein
LQWRDTNLSADACDEAPMQSGKTSKRALALGCFPEGMIGIEYVYRSRRCERMLLIWIKRS